MVAQDGKGFLSQLNKLLLIVQVAYKIIAVGQRPTGAQNFDVITLHPLTLREDFFIQQLSDEINK